MTTVNFWQGEKVLLRAVEPEDWMVCFESNLDTETARRYDRIYFPASKERMKKWCTEQSMLQGEDYRWVIENKEGQIVGMINTFDCNFRYGTFRYGVGIHKNYQRNGYGREALKIVLQYFFKELRYTKVTASVYSFNEPSLELHHKMGFQKEGHLRKMCYTDGHYYDEIIFGMTDEEFEKNFSQ